MKINLKQLRYQINSLDLTISDLEAKKSVPVTVNDLKAILSFIKEVEEDLSFSEKATVVLDMPLAEALT